MSVSLCCDHCGIAIPPEDLVAQEIDGVPRNFCCHGCALAYQIVCDAGLAGYYRTRQLTEPGLPNGAFTLGFDAPYLERFVTVTPQGAQLTFLIEGVRCASCVWVIEQIVRRIDGVEEIRVNYGTHRARLRFDPRRVAPIAVLRELARLGYAPRPFSLDEAQRSAVREGRTLLIRFGTAALFSMQVMGFTLPLYAGYFQGIDPESRRAMTWLAAVSTVPVVFYSGWPFLSGAWRSLKNRAANMDLLVALGVLVSFAYSLAALVIGGEVYFDSAAMIVTLVLLGRLLEHFARQRALGRIDRLLQLTPDQARKVVDGRIVVVPSNALIAGDLVVIHPGERFPVDGVLLDAATEVDEAALTGEPLPVLRDCGAAVSAGTINLLTTVTVRATGTTADSLVARIARMVEESLARRAPIERLADRVAALFVPLVLATAIATAVGWRLAGVPVHDGLLRAVAVLVVACPCALGLATPMAILVATGAGATRGILFRGGDVLERCAKVTSIAFDKTGTLTIGRPHLVAIRPADGVERDALLAAAAIGAVSSSHPLATGIATALRDSYNIPLPLPLPARALPGRGVVIDRDDGPLFMGSRALLLQEGIEVGDLSGESLTEVHLAAGGRYLGALLLDDPLRDDAPDALRTLKGLGLHTALLTGDRPETAQRIAARLAISDIAAQQTPEGKRRWVEERSAAGATVMMVGDGINDAPALAAAAVGCAMAGGTAIALETSDLVLTKPSLTRLTAALKLARSCVRIVRQNLFWAFVYNLLAIPLAISGTLAPIHAAAAMALSSLCVVANSLRLTGAGKD